MAQSLRALTYSNGQLAAQLRDAPCPTDAVEVKTKVPSTIPIAAPIALDSDRHAAACCHCCLARVAEST